MQYYSATLVRGHKKTMRYGKIGGARNNRCNIDGALLKNDAILQRDNKKHCEMDADQ